jgi:hypothetical protein
MQAYTQHEFHKYKVWNSISTMGLPIILAISVFAVLGSSLMLLGVFSLDSIILSKGRDYQVQEAGAQALPLEVRDRFSEKKLVGDANNIKVNEDFIDPENHCEFCTLIEYRPGLRGMAGYAYENDTGLDLTGANKVRFWIMGEQGNERVKFKIAGKSYDSIEDRRPNRPTNSIFESERFALTTEELTLANDWRKYEIDLTGVSLDNITHPFGFELSKGNGAQKQVIYIKGLVFDDEPVEGEYALAAIGETAINTPPPLAVGIVSNGTEGEAPATFKFEANITGGTEPYTINWNFEDGSEQRNDETVVHTFGEADTYNVTLTATDSDDQTASDSAEIEVEVGAEIDEENEDIQEQEAVEEQGLEASGEDQTDSTQNNARAANNTRE